MFLSLDCYVFWWVFSMFFTPQSLSSYLQSNTMKGRAMDTLAGILHRTQRLVFKSIFPRFYFQSHPKCTEATWPIMPRFSSASCLTDKLLAEYMAGLMDFPSSPSYPVFLVPNSGDGSHPPPTSASCPQQQRWACPLDYAISFGTFTLSALYKFLQPWYPFSCLTVSHHISFLILTYFALGLPLGFVEICRLTW